MQPVGFAQQALYTVPACSFCMAAGRKSDLDRRICLKLRTRNYPVHKANASFADHTDILPATVKQGANQALPLKAECARQFLKRAQAPILWHDHDLRLFAGPRVAYGKDVAAFPASALEHSAPVF